MDVRRRHELDLRRANHPKTPTSGYFFQGGVEFAGVGGDVQYIRLSAEGRYYYPITEKITFVGRAIGGHIEGWGGQDVRLLDLYYKGGETIRGFYMSGFGPRDTLTTMRWAANVLVDDGGAALPVPVDTRRSRHERRGFCGRRIAVWGRCRRQEAPELLRHAGPSIRHRHHDLARVCLADFAAIRASVGFGILWNSPLGPLRLDIAKALLKESYDKEQLIRFGASTRF